MSETCPTCSRPYPSAEIVKHSQDMGGGCECELCLSVCWMRWTGWCQGGNNWHAIAGARSAEIVRQAARIAELVAIVRMMVRRCESDESAVNDVRMRWYEAQIDRVDYEEAKKLLEVKP